MSKTSLCFVSPTAYPVLSGQPHLGQIGGADVQQALVARELARRGYDISFVTYDHGQPDGMDCAGVQVFKMCRPRAGLPAVRFLHPAWTSLWHAMTRANASVYYQRTAACETGQCALWCRLNRRRFIFAVASDTDCDPRDTSLGTHLDRWLFRAGIRLADRVIAQTRSQYARLRGGFGLEPVLIGSCGAEPTDAMKPADFSAARARRLLWIGRISPKKGFELLLDFAGAAPEFVFDVVTDTRINSDYAKRLLAHARMLPNIAVHGQMPPARAAEFYDRAGLFTCTSLVEGFPNTFLEAWARGVPTLSTVDPDGIIQSGRLGSIGASAGDLRRLAHELLDAPDRWRECSDRARSHFARHHRVEGIVDIYERLLNDLTKER